MCVFVCAVWPEGGGWEALKRSGGDKRWIRIGWQIEYVCVSQSTEWTTTGCCCCLLAFPIHSFIHSSFTSISTVEAAIHIAQPNSSIALPAHIQRCHIALHSAKFSRSISMYTYPHLLHFHFQNAKKYSHHYRLCIPQFLAFFLIQNHFLIVIIGIALATEIIQMPMPLNIRCIHHSSFGRFCAAPIHPFPPNSSPFPICFLLFVFSIFASLATRYYSSPRSRDKQHFENL